MAACTHSHSFRPIKPFQKIAIRGNHLLHHMFTKNPTRRLTYIKKKPVIPPEQVKLHLLDYDGSNLGPMTLASAFSFIKPHTHLAQVQRKSVSPCFQIKALKAFSPDCPKNQRLGNKWFKRLGLGKEFHLTSATTPEYLKHVLNKCCQYILQGARIQFTLHQKHNRKDSGPPIDYALENCPQLRPDTILRAMPEGTTMLAHPCITPEAMAKAQMKAGIDPPVSWAVEHAPSIKRAGLNTPEWIKKMATWDLELKVNPEHNGKLTVEGIWKYSVARNRALAQERKVSDTSQVPNRAGDHPSGTLKSTTLDELVP